jgi:MFS superfamily sulfate permease-like transporter
VYYANAAVFKAEIHKALSGSPHPPSVLVVDADAITDIDYTGTRTIRALVDELERSHIVVALARAVGGAPQNLARSGLLDQIGSNRIFTTVDEAVTALRPGGST